jgi:hypothetical protein
MAIKQSPSKKPLPKPRNPIASITQQNAPSVDAKNAQAIYNQLMQYQMANYPNQYGMAGQIPPPPIRGLGDQLMQYQMANYPNQYGMAGQIPPPPSSGLESMDIYNQLMRKQLANYAEMNQDAATNFGNIEPGKISTQPAKTTTAKPQVPIAGIGMQQTASQNQQRNFSTPGYPSPKPFG